MIVKNSERLKFEQFSANDAELLFQLDQDVEVMRYINGGKMTTRKEIKEVYIPRMKSYSNPQKGWGLWKLSLQENNKFIGSFLVRPMSFFSDSPEYDNLEIGWRLSRDSWGCGYATEAARQIVQALIEKGGISKLTALAFEENTASTNIMRKLGMKYLKKDIHKDPLGDEEVVFYQLELKV